MNKKIVFIYLVFLMLGVVVFNGAMGQAAVIQVATKQDNVPGSLRAAITEANMNDEDDIIDLPAGKYFLGPGADDNHNISGDLDIYSSQSITIRGEDTRTTIIDGNGNDRVLQILNGTVSIYYVAIQGGKCDDNNGGGIYNDGELTLINCAVRSNGAYLGGGIYNNGSLTLTNCTINNNTNSGGWDRYHNDGGSGGGIYNNNIITLTNCTISNNMNGKGFDDMFDCYAGDGGSGGGIFNSSGSTAFITSCTISGNSAGLAGYNEDGMHCHWVYTYDGRGGGICNGSTVTIKNTIIANNTGDGPDANGTLNSQGYNLIENTDQCTITGITKGNITGIDPLLGPLAYNEGPTKTQALLPGSPAIDAGYSFGSIDDQRGFVRPYDVADIPDVKDGSDIGAYEYASYLPSPTYTISGKITYYGTGLPGVTVAFSNNGGTTATGTDGNYSHPLPYGWSGSVTPTKEGYTFNPSSRNYTTLTTNQSNQDYSAVSLVPPQISLLPTQLYFGADTSGKQTGPQSFLISNSGGGILKWAAAVNADWLSCNPASGTGPALVTVSINPTGLATKTYTGTIEVEDPNAVNSPQIVTVTLTVYEAGSTHLPFGSFDTPIDGAGVTGSIPVTGWALDNIGIEYVKIYRDPVSGEGSGLIYIGDALLVEGARPDIEAAYPGYPENYKAGWGYMMLTYGLPDQGNGTYTLYANAGDKEGNVVTLGSKTIYGDNAHAVKPFGAIDAPAQGGTASGSDYPNYGWALTPLPNTIPTTGSTITVWVDGIPLGHPVYNENRPDVAALFPGYNNSAGAGGHFHLDTTAYENGVHTVAWSVTDNAGNSDGIGSRYFIIQNLPGSKEQEEVKTTNYKLQITNKFQIPNSKFQTERRPSGTRRVAYKGFETPAAIDVETQDIASLPLAQNTNTVSTNSSEPVRLQKGYNPKSEPETLSPDENGRFTVEIKELERLVIYLDGLEIQSDRGEYKEAVSEPRERIENDIPGEYEKQTEPHQEFQDEGRGEPCVHPIFSNSHSTLNTQHLTLKNTPSPQYYGYLVNGDVLKPLPIGSTLDHSRGIFYWQPGPGFLGDYELVFVEKTGIGEGMKKHIIIRIKPHSGRSATAAY